MKLEFKMQYFKTIYDRYQKASKILKEKILDEFCKVCKYNRKYAIFKLNGTPPREKIYAEQKIKVKRNRPTFYSHEAISLIAKVWQAADFACSKRLKVIITLWLPWIIKHFNPSPKIKAEILKISARQLDRRLKPYRIREGQRLYGRTKPGTLLKHHIPIKTDHWDVKKPGFTEVDTVSHSGSSADGVFAYSVSQTDILTEWVEVRSVLTKGEKVVNTTLEEMEKVFPFKILGIDADNGGEFINHHLVRRCQKQKIQFTRSRPYKKDDNAHIEQKNRTHVRKLMGWYRYDTQEVVDLMNDLYANELSLFMNLFMPSMKLSKTRYLAGKANPRHHDDPATPLDRLIASGQGDPAKISHYKKLRELNDPFALSQTIERKLKAIYNKANCRFSPRPGSEKTETQPRKQKAKKQQEEEALVEVARLFGMPIIKGGKTYHG